MESRYKINMILPYPQLWQETKEVLCEKDTKEPRMKKMWVYVKLLNISKSLLIAHSVPFSISNARSCHMDSLEMVVRTCHVHESNVMAKVFFSWKREWIELSNESIPLTLTLAQVLGCMGIKIWGWALCIIGPSKTKLEDLGGPTEIWWA